MWEKILSAFISFIMVFTTFMGTTLQKTVHAQSNTDSNVTIERLAGADRYKTAVEICKKGWKDKSDYVVLANGENFPDALSAAPLAKKYNAPILLTSKDILNEDTKSELQRLNVKQVLIVGGSGVISENIESILNSMNITVKRFYGKDRYETSIKVAEEVGLNNNGIFVANGENFPDALSVAPIAAQKGMPIILVPKDNLTESTDKYVSNKSINKAYVIGSSNSVSESIVSKFKNTERIFGASRYATNAAIIEKFENDLDFSNICVANGENFPDGLSGSVLAASGKEPILLVNEQVDESTKVLVNKKSSLLKKVRVLGGSSVVSDIITEGIRTNFQNTSDDNLNFDQNVLDNNLNFEQKEKNIETMLNTYSNNASYWDHFVDTNRYPYYIYLDNYYSAKGSLPLLQGAESFFRVNIAPTLIGAADKIYNGGGGLLFQDQSKDRAKSILLSMIKNSGEDWWNYSLVESDCEYADNLISVLENEIEKYPEEFEKAYNELNEPIQNLRIEMAQRIYSGEKVDSQTILESEYVKGLIKNKGELVRKLEAEMRMISKFKLDKVTKGLGIVLNTVDFVNVSASEYQDMCRLLQADSDFISFLSYIEANSETTEVKQAARELKDYYKNEVDKKANQIFDAALKGSISLTDNLIKGASFQVAFATYAMDKITNVSENIDWLEKLRLSSAMSVTLEKKMKTEIENYKHPNVDSDKKNAVDSIYKFAPYLFALRLEAEKNLFEYLKARGANEVEEKANLNSVKSNVETLSKTFYKDLFSNLQKPVDWKLLYREKLKEILPEYGDLVALIDINLDGTPELLIGYPVGSGGFSEAYCAYTIKNGSLVSILRSDSSFDIEDIDSSKLYYNSSTNKYQIVSESYVQNGAFYRIYSTYIYNLNNDILSQTEVIGRVEDEQIMGNIKYTYMVSGKETNETEYTEAKANLYNGWKEVGGFGVALKQVTSSINDINNFLDSYTSSININ